MDLAVVCQRNHSVWFWQWKDAAVIDCCNLLSASLLLLFLVDQVLLRTNVSLCQRADEPKMERRSFPRCFSAIIVSMDVVFFDS
jgi:hypothetical protein